MSWAGPGGRRSRSGCLRCGPTLRSISSSSTAKNATSGNGLSEPHAKAILEAGADCITLGDHAFDQRDMNGFIEREPRVLRPMNYAKTAPGVGARLL